MIPVDNLFLLELKGRRIKISFYNFALSSRRFFYGQIYCAYRSNATSVGDPFAFGSKTADELIAIDAYIKSLYCDISLEYRVVVAKSLG